MNVIIYSYTDDDWEERQQMHIDGKFVMSVGGGEPEDMRIGRDLVPCQEIASFMKKAFDAAKNGEEFTLEVKECTEDEWDEL